MLGTYALSSGYKDAYYLKALKVRRLIRDDFDKAFAELRRGHRPDVADGGVQDRREDAPTRWRCTCPTSTRSAATWPASPGVSVPCGFTKSGLPIGLQILARSVRGRETAAHRPHVREGDRLAHAPAAIIIGQNRLSLKR